MAGTCARMFVVDAFTSRPFAGNPACICLLSSDPLSPHAAPILLSSSAMQTIAKEQNLSETAFLVPLRAAREREREGKREGEGEGGLCFANASRFGLRWFTPTNEVNLCGHATLAAAHVLFECCGNASPALVFETASGDLVVRRQVVAERSGAQTHVLGMQFPANPPLPLRDLAVAARFAAVDLHAVLGCVLSPVVGSAVIAAAVARLQQAPDGKAASPGTGEDVWIEELAYSAQTKKLVVNLGGQGRRDALARIVPDTQAMLRAHDGSVFTGISVTIAGGAGHADAREGSREADADFLSRYFAPWNGIPEDPVNGSSHTVLAPYWKARAQGNGGRGTPERPLIAFQASKRGGRLYLSVDEGVGRVVMAGQAVVVTEGWMRLDGAEGEDDQARL